MTAAAQARPGDPAITRDLVHLLQANNRGADAQAYLDKLAENPHLPLQFRYWLVQTYADQGANDKAIALLEKDEPAGSSAERDRVLARLYRRVGRGQEAARLYTGLLDKPIADAAFWDEAADFFAARHDMPTANKFMTKLGQLKLHPGELELNRGQFAEKWLTVDDALKEFRQAVKLAPQVAATWGSLGGFQMRQRHFTEAVSAADEGLKVAPGNPALQALRSHASSLSGLGDVAEFQPLIEVLCRTPQDPGATEMLAAIVASHNGRLPPATTAQKLREVADRYPQNLLLQLQVIQSLQAAGQTDAALDVARKSATAYPNRPEPQARLTSIYVETGDWARAEQAALLWRKNSPDQPMAANLALARIYLQESKKDPAGAIRVLTPYVSGPSHTQNPTALELYAKALVLVDRTSEAANLLKPLANNSAEWRAKWLELATSQKDAAAASKWIAEMAPSIPDDRLPERFALAHAWYAVGMQFESSEAFESASHVLEPLLAEGKETPNAWMLAGEIASARSDYAGAEKAYRQAIRLDPNSPMALNDLAYVLWMEGQDQKLAEARTFAESAIAAKPQTASFYDTLARIESRAGDQKSAAQNFRNALAKDPNSLEAKIGLADLLARNPATRKQAKELLAQIQATVDASPRLPSVLKKQYQNARDAVASSL
jgi:tetratricopeptide (TPR) repeat protein